MIMKTLHYKNAEGIDLYSADWPVSNPKAVIALVHGQGEHIGRYAHVAAWFNRHGVALTGFDQQGHGQSGGNRGHARNLDVLLDDVGQFVADTHVRYPGVPVFLYGHSMGGGIALNYVARRGPGTLAGLIVTDPWIQLAFEAPAIKVMAAKLLNGLVPKLSMPTGLAIKFLSHDAAVVEAYKNDPLVHGRMSAAAGVALLGGGAWLHAYTGTLLLPTLLQHGGDDQITSPAATRAFVERVKGDLTYHEWPGLYHEIHNEANQDAVFQYTLDWMEYKLRVAPKN